MGKAKFSVDFKQDAVAQITERGYLEPWSSTLRPTRATAERSEHQIDVTNFVPHPCDRAKQTAVALQ